MNNTVENDCLGFPKVKWLQYISKVGKCISCYMLNFLGNSRTKKH